MSGMFCMNCSSHDCVCEMISKEQERAAKKLARLRDRWLCKTGEPMPAEISALPLERVQRAVELVEDGQMPVVPKQRAAVRRDPEFGTESSLREWDRDSEF